MNLIKNFILFCTGVYAIVRAAWYYRDMEELDEDEDVENESVKLLDQINHVVIQHHISDEVAREWCADRGLEPIDEPQKVYCNYEPDDGGDPELIEEQLEDSFIPVTAVHVRIVDIDKLREMFE